jgi:hypothetical protein
MVMRLLPKHGDDLEFTTQRTHVGAELLRSGPVLGQGEV